MNTNYLFRLAGLSAIIAGLSFLVLGIFHPLNIISSVTTTTWIVVHIFACIMSFFGLFAMAGLYVKQFEKFSWLGFVGFVMFSLWLALVMCFSFVEAFIFPALAAQAPMFVSGILGMFHGLPSEVGLGVLPILWSLSGILFILGGLLFGIATFRAKILPKYAGLLLALGTGLAPLAALLPFEYQTKILVFTGIAFVWFGYALLVDKKENPKA